MATWLYNLPIYNDIDELVADNKLQEALELAHKYSVETGRDPVVMRKMAEISSKMNRPEDAVKFCELGLAINPLDPITLLTYSGSLGGIAKYKEAAQAAKNAMTIIADFSLAEWNYSLYNLALGNLEEGWKYHSARYKSNNTQIKSVQKQIFTRNNPHLEDILNNKKKFILVYCEQGVGDAFLFIRYLKIIRQIFPNLTIYLESYDSSTSLFSYQDFADLCIDMTMFGTYHVDAYIALHDIPYLFGNLIVMGRSKDYVGIHVPQDVCDGTYSCRTENAINVGISYRGNKNYGNSINRCIQSENDLALFVDYVREIHGTDAVIHNLTYDATPEESEKYGLKPTNTMMSNWLITGGILSNMDYVHTTDNGIANMAANIIPGRATVYLSYAPDWRWCTNMFYSDSIIRKKQQTKLRDWSSCFGK